MANEQKRAAASERKDAAAGSEKRYRIIHTIVLGKGEAREERASGTITASEVGGEHVVDQLLKSGMIADPDAPVRPSEASEHRAKSVLIDLAITHKLITKEGDKYAFAGKSFASESELQSIPLADLSAAIDAALRK